MKNVLVVSNFNAGRKKALQYRKTLQKFLLKNAESFKFVSIEDFDNTDIEIYDTIIAMGGDGTINKIAQYIVNTDKRLGIIPCGTANLLSEKLGISSNIKKAVNKLKSDNIQKIDVIKINDKISTLRFGCGYDAEIICKTPQSLKNKFGYLSYLIAGILFVLRLRLKDYSIVLNEEERTIKASCIIIANASNMYKKMFCVGNKTLLDDGLFDIFILKTSNPILFFVELLKISINYYKNSKNAEFFKSDDLLIKTNWLNAHIDGDEHKFNTNISFKIIKKAIKIIA